MVLNNSKQPPWISTLGAGYLNLCSEYDKKLSPAIQLPDRFNYMGKGASEIRF